MQTTDEGPVGRLRKFNCKCKAVLPAESIQADGFPQNSFVDEKDSPREMEPGMPIEAHLPSAVAGAKENLQIQYVNTSRSSEACICGCQEDGELR